jgi:uncharacterized membrane protein
MKFHVLWNPTGYYQHHKIEPTNATLSKYVYWSALRLYHQSLCVVIISSLLTLFSLLTPLINIKNKIWILNILWVAFQHQRHQSITHTESTMLHITVILSIINMLLCAGPQQKQSAMESESRLYCHDNALNCVISLKMLWAAVTDGRMIGLLSGSGEKRPWPISRYYTGSGLEKLRKTTITQVWLAGNPTTIMCSTYTPPKE